MTQTLKNKARFLTLVLRHKPEEIEIELDYHGGWANVKDVLKALDISLSELDQIVDNDSKNRFGYNSNKIKIRANQGHSVDVDLELYSQKPPEFLFHGTVRKYIPWIKVEGLKKMTRHHVHLSSDLETAEQVASRRQTDNVLLEIDALQMYVNGFKFYLSENEVWLTETVPTKYIINL